MMMVHIHFPYINEVRQRPALPSTETCGCQTIRDCGDFGTMIREFCSSESESESPYINQPRMRTKPTSQEEQKRILTPRSPMQQLPRFGGLSHFGGAFGFHSEPEIPQGCAAKQPLAKT